MTPTYKVSIATGGLAVALAFAVQACGKNAAAETAPAAPVVTLVAEDLATVERRELAIGPIVTGTLTARTHATIRAELGGTVVETFADRGMQVSAGARLLRIEDRAVRDAQASALSDVRTEEEGILVARRRLTRSTALHAGGAISSEEVEDVQHALTSAESRLAAARARLSSASDALNRTVVRAPFAGVVSARPVNAGDVVESGNVLFEVLDPTTMYLESAVPSADLATVRVGAAVAFSVTGYPGRMFNGRIERVSPAADPATRQVPVFITIQNDDRRLVAGLFAEGRVAPTVGPALLVPGAAIERDKAVTSVVRFANGRIERRAVETGRQDSDGTVVEIRSGLTLGDTVLIGVSRSLPTGTAARVADGKTVVTSNAR
jgi:membrane fusion protein (multidrug efflux system)